MDFCTLHTVEKIQWEEKTNYYDCQNAHCVTFLFIASAVVALLIFKPHVCNLLVLELFIIWAVCQPSWTHLQKTIPCLPVCDGSLLV